MKKAIETMLGVISLGMFVFCFLFAMISHNFIVQFVLVVIATLSLIVLKYIVEKGDK